MSPKDIAEFILFCAVGFCAGRIGLEAWCIYRDMPGSRTNRAIAAGMILTIGLSAVILGGYVLKLFIHRHLG